MIVVREIIRHLAFNPILVLFSPLYSLVLSIFLLLFQSYIGSIFSRNGKRILFPLTFFQSYIGSIFSIVI